MMENIKVGQEVWFKDTYTDVNSGVVTEICTGEAEGYVKIKGTGDTFSTGGTKIKNCYPTKQALLDALQAGWDAKVAAYKESIRTVGDLVRFCFEHNFSAEEYTDWEARKAAQARAKELLGLELE